MSFDNMCGIIAISSNKNCISPLIKGLKSLEYRGYDSSGIAYQKKNKIFSIKSVGNISNLIKKINNNINCPLIIGHTRWATHGKPLEKNAHPFVKKNCAIVHNGIVENYNELKKKYSINNQIIKSETDTEIISLILNKLLDKNFDPIESLREISKKIEGNYAFVVMIKNSNSIFAICKGSPLIIGRGKNFCSLSSDILGLPDDTEKTIYLEDNEIAEINSYKYTVYNKIKKLIKKEFKYLEKKDQISKNNFKYFMEKEIFYQPTSIKNTILNYANNKTNNFLFPKNFIDFKNIKNINFAACGTAYHACMIAKYWIEEITHINSSADIASEFRYRNLKIDKNSIGIVVSQSGETMDTLESLKKFKEKNIITSSITNVLNSTISRKSDYVLPTLAGPEIGVASTKAFTSQLVVLSLLSLFISKYSKTPKSIRYSFYDSLFKIPNQIEKILNDSLYIKKIANKLKNAKSIFYIGRGTMYPLALEGALKLKEITYKHCEGYAGGELKHGPLALIENNIPVIALAPYDKNFKKLLSNIQEIKTRGGKIILITDKKGSKKISKEADEIIIMPNTNLITAPIIYSLPIQLISFYLGVILKTNVDQPRNLAKAVTVE